MYGGSVLAVGTYRRSHSQLTIMGIKLIEDFSMYLINFTGDQRAGSVLVQRISLVIQGGNAVITS